MVRFGRARVRLTSADCTNRLRQLSRTLELKDLIFPSPLEAEFTIDCRELGRISIPDGERLEVLSKTGPEGFLRWLRNWYLTIFVVLLLGGMTAFLPGRILFFRVEGNGEIPQRQILEAAEGCGLAFGSSSRELRSEQVKNHLLHEIPELRWAGVNTCGCIATITVRLRDPDDGAGEKLPGDLTAVRDAVVTEVHPQSGTAMISPGDGVRAGQVLISGMTDLGICTRTDRAEGDVYGVTSHAVRAVLPEQTAVFRETGHTVRKFSLLLGKKRINFTSDSGIFQGTCVKMRTVNYLTLPGGFVLPAAVITETWYECQWEQVPRGDCTEALLEEARRYVLGNMIAGQILQESYDPEDYALDAAFSCREMIARFRDGVTVQGETNDRENGERGTG